MGYSFGSYVSPFCGLFLHSTYDNYQTELWSFKKCHIGVCREWWWNFFYYCCTHVLQYRRLLHPKIASVLKKLVPFSQHIYKAVNLFLLELFINVQEEAMNHPKFPHLLSQASWGFVFLLADALQTGKLNSGLKRFDNVCLKGWVTF